MKRKTPIRQIPVSVEVHEAAKSAAEVLGLTLKEFTEDTITQRLRKERKKLEAAALERTAAIDRLLDSK